jgi:competence protein ComEC
MVCVLAIALLAVAMQEFIGDLWSKSLFGVFSALCVVSFIKWVRQAKDAWIWIPATVLVGISLFISFCHSIYKRDADQRMVSWAENTAAIMEMDGLETVTWQPIAFRGVVESAFRFRKAVLPGQPTDTTTIGAPENVDWQSLTVVQVTGIRVKGVWEPRSLWMPLAIDGKITDCFPGDVVEVYGQWRLPSKPSNPGQFNQAKRFAELGYSAQSRTDSGEQIKRVGVSNRWRLDRLLAQVSGHALRAIEQHVILRQSELTAALVLGQREQAEWRLQEELLATGSIHMLSISGMHIEMVALAMLLVGSYFQLPRKPLLAVVCVMVIAYALLCGGNPPVARATLMLTGLCVAKWNGWRFSSLNFLAFAGFLLILYRPSVVFEAGTQLSFMAVAVLILSARGPARRQPPLEKLIDSKSSAASRNLRAMAVWAREMLRTSFWVWFITAPLVWSTFHVVSPIAILLNLLLWLPMLVALIAGLGLVVFGWLPPVAWPLGVACGLSLWIVDVLVGWGELVPTGHFWLRSPPAWWLFGFYAVGIVTSASHGVKRASSRRRLILVLGAWFALGVLIRPTEDAISRWTGPTERKFCLTFIDVGHGTNILMETPDQNFWMYDAGRLGDHQRSYQVMVDALWAMQIPRLDGFVLSHADSDHYNGLSGIAKRFQIKNLYSTEQVFQHSSPLLKENLDAAKTNGAKFKAWRKGDYHYGADWSFLVMHPPSQGVEGTDNANSLCLMLEYAGRRVLLPGDLEPPGMQLLVAQDKTKVDVLMAPHHGSLNSKSDSLLAGCDPKMIVISGSHRAVSPRVLSSFAADDRKVFVTVRDHAIRIEIDSQGDIVVKQWLADRWSNVP